MYQKHLPFLFKKKSGYTGVLERKFRSLSLLTRASLRVDMSWEDALYTLNILRAVPATSVIHKPPDEMKAMCTYQGWPIPENPINSPSVLFH